MIEYPNAITFRGVSLRTDRLQADLIRGGPWDSAPVRGKDWIIPGAVGEEVRARISTSREIELRIPVIGIGATRQDRSDDWNESLMDLIGIMDFSLSPGVLLVDGSYLGIPAGVTYSINARCMNQMLGPVQNHMSYQLRSYVLKATDPVWVADSES